MCIKQKLLDLYTSCSKKGWDSYDADPISKETYLKGLEFLDLFDPLINLDRFDVYPDVEGCLAFYLCDMCIQVSDKGVDYILARQGVVIIGEEDGSVVSATRDKPRELKTFFRVPDQEKTTLKRFDAAIITLEEQIKHLKDSRVDGAHNEPKLNAIFHCLGIYRDLINLEEGD